jgi:hypothetical protein
MFMSIDRGTDQPVVSLEDQYSDEELRALGREGSLVCPECRSPVHFRRAEPHRRHFVHTHRQDCPHDSQKPAIASALPVLYDWLRTKFPGNVRVEYQPSRGERLLRPIDLCVVDKGRLKAAYWLFMGGRQRYNEVRRFFTRARVLVNWIYVGSLQDVEPSTALGAVAHPIPDAEQPSWGNLHLSPVHRDLITRTRYDAIRALGSVHFLDPESQQLTTYRDLQLVHGPQGFYGRVFCSAVSSLLTHGDGELCHRVERQPAQ